MTDFRDLSRLPRDEGYWKALEERIVGELRPSVREAERARPRWWEPLATRAWSLGALAAAAGFAALLVLPPRTTERPVNPAGLLRLPEDDPRLVALLTAPVPPQLGSMVIPNSPGGER